MKVKELIKQLKKQDPEKLVMIQQGEEFDYMTVYSVKERMMVDMSDIKEDEITVVAIEYN